MSDFPWILWMFFSAILPIPYAVIAHAFFGRSETLEGLAFMGLTIGMPIAMIVYWKRTSLPTDNEEGR